MSSSSSTSDEDQSDANAEDNNNLTDAVNQNELIRLSSTGVSAHAPQMPNVLQNGLLKAETGIGGTEPQQIPTYPVIYPPQTTQYFPAYGLYGSIPYGCYVDGSLTTNSTLNASNYLAPFQYPTAAAGVGSERNVVHCNR